MKVLFVSTLYAPNEMGGAERSDRILAEALVARGHEVVVVSLARDGRARQDVVDGVRTYYVPLANIHWPLGDAQPDSPLRRALWHAIDAYNPVMGRRLGAILDRERPDFVQTGNLKGFSAAAWRAARQRGIPVLQMVHDYYLGCPNASMFRHGHNCEGQCRPCRVYAAPRRALSSIPSAVIGVSRRTLDRLEGCGLFAGVPHRFVMHGANAVRCSPPARSDRAAGAPLRVGYLGRLEATKGVEVLLEAAARLPTDAVSVLIGGTGTADYEAALRARYAAPNVEFLGFVKPGELFGRIDLLVAPSVWEEPLGRVIFEAYEHGVPVVVSRAGGMPEIVEEGRTGFVFQTGDAADLAAVLGRHIGAPWPAGRFFEACRAKSHEFSTDHLVEQYRAIVDQTLSLAV